MVVLVIGQIVSMRKSAEYAYTARWWSLLSSAAQVSFASSISDISVELLQPMTDTPPAVEEVLDMCRYEEGSLVSRLPLRS